MAKCIWRWHAGLSLAHNSFCNHAHPATCPGLRPLPTLLATPQWEPCPPGTGPACPQGTEAELLLHEIYWGVRILPPGVSPASVPPFQVHNYPVSDRVQTAITTTVAKELAAGRIYELPARPPHLTAIWGKEEGPVKVRIITDFSQQEGASVNDFTDNLHFSMQSHDDAFALLTPGAYMAKVDVAQAYRTVGVHPDHHHLLSFDWRDPASGALRFYGDTRLPFGHAKAPELFCRISAAVRAILAAHGHGASVVFVDDFLLIGTTEPVCRAALRALSALLASLGFEESLPKRCEPAQRQVFLGLQYDTATPGPHPVTVTVPEAKLRKAEDLATQLATAPTVSLRALQSAVGYFNHVSYAVWSARAFTRRLIDTTKAARRTAGGCHQAIRITTGMRLDLHWWRRFARAFNGQAIILERPVQWTGFFSTDACDAGMGGFLSGEFFSLPWRTPFHQAFASMPLPARTDSALRGRLDLLWPRPGTPSWHDVSYRELFALLWAHVLWGPPRLANTHVTVHNDNNVVVHDVNYMTSPNIHRMALLRALFGHNARYNIRSRATRITSQANILSDSASRLDMVTFRQAEAEWRAAVAQTHPAWPGSGADAFQARVPRNPGLYTHRAALALQAAAAPAPSPIAGVRPPVRASPLTPADERAA